MTSNATTSDPDTYKIELAELYARDPREMTDADFTRLIENLREARSKYIFENDKKAGGPRKPAKKKTAAETKFAAVAIDVDL